MRTTLAAALLALALPAPAAARTLSVRDEAKLAYVHSSGTQIVDEGPTRGTLPGHARVRFTYDGRPNVSASFTFSGRGWSISGRASARLHNPYNPTPSFRGRLTITAGSGRYAHARGEGELFGVFNRLSSALTVQALVTLRY